MKQEQSGYVSVFKNAGGEGAFKKAYCLRLCCDADAIRMLSYPLPRQILGLMRISKKRIDNALEERRENCFERAFG